MKVVYQKTFFFWICSENKRVKYLFKNLTLFGLCMVCNLRGEPRTGYQIHHSAFTICRADMHHLQGHWFWKERIEPLGNAPIHIIFRSRFSSKWCIRAKTEYCTGGGVKMWGVFLLNYWYHIFIISIDSLRWSNWNRNLLWVSNQENKLLDKTNNFIMKDIWHGSMVTLTRFLKDTVSLLDSDFVEVYRLS